MAAQHSLLSALFIVTVFTVSSNAARDTRVEVTSVNPATIGGILAIQCQVWNIRDTYKVNFFHDVNGQTEQLTFDNHYLSSSLGQRSYLAKRTFPDGSHVLFLTVVDVEHGDEGKYLCKAYTMLNGRFTDIAEDSKLIRIHSFPRKLYPVCQSTPNKASVTVGDMLRLKCTSERTFPLVTLIWSSSSDSSISHNNRNTTTNYEVSFEASLILRPSHN